MVMINRVSENLEKDRFESTRNFNLLLEKEF